MYVNILYAFRGYHTVYMMNLNMIIDLPTEHATQKMAERIAACLVSPLVLIFRGEIGAGKTTLIRAMLRCLGVSSSIKSPTFSLVESYQSEHFQLHHFDLYRIHDETELDYIGFRDYFRDNAICCIEWPERAGRYLMCADIGFTLGLKGAGREMTIEAFTPAGAAVLSCLAGDK
jgi:tRNA threonylcarbamoyladenosine biosynthesis protein TsaE